MSPRRRLMLQTWPWSLGSLAALSPRVSVLAASQAGVSDPLPLQFPRDHGAHLSQRIEWWYATGWLTRENSDLLIGFQCTFFRSRTGLGDDQPGRLMPRQLLFAHAAISELRPGGHRHAQRLARWSGEDNANQNMASTTASTTDTRLQLAAWRLARQDEGGRSAYTARLAAPEAGFALELRLAATQPVLLQGVQGLSLKGPPEVHAKDASTKDAHFSRYYSQVQLDTQAIVTLAGRDHVMRGRAWLDHEWSDSLMPPSAVGWDWLGINLNDGSALTAFVLRAADGRAVWAGGSHRPAAAINATTTRNFAAHEVQFTALRHWLSPSTGARYPVRWRITTPAGEHEIEALLDAQELDSRASSGAVYWEGLAELRDLRTQRVGLGYLEMTGYFGSLRLG